MSVVHITTYTPAGRNSLVSLVVLAAQAKLQVRSKEDDREKRISIPMICSFFTVIIYILPWISIYTMIRTWWANKSANIVAVYSADMNFNKDLEHYYDLNKPIKNG
jgi:hypothetical protein